MPYTRAQKLKLKNIKKQKKHHKNVPLIKNAPPAKVGHVPHYDDLMTNYADCSDLAVMSTLHCYAAMTSSTSTPSTLTCHALAPVLCIARTDHSMMPSRSMYSTSVTAASTQSTAGHQQ